ncbi:MAG: spore germination protein [Muribaculaceae bacterium]|nr:spore germination protein [Roseburia sp.]MCM1430649.1 spore germination protein [Muribaculaceae bacterium]MCM1491916.1 spore germination protein [Muribaculaceae bacterium]
MTDKTKISTDLEKNIAEYQRIFAECADIKMRRMALGSDKKRECFLAYIEGSVTNMMLENTALGRALAYLGRTPDADVGRVLDDNAMGISDVTPFTYIEDAANGMLTGDAILFVDGYDKALKIADKGYPGAGVQEPDSEKVIRGSKEGFTDSVKTNTALIRKRIRSTRVKIKNINQGVYSHTLVSLVYMEDLAYPSVLEEIEKRLTEYEIDGVMDSGILEQLAERKWYSPFPQFQTTQRPDRAALAVMEGRVVVMSDNSPTALILPTDFNSFLKTSDDYYNRFEVATFARILRFLAAFFAMSLPGLYLAVTNFHTQILPTPLLLSFWEARIGVPFPAVLEVILMELSFELLREAGVRLPGAMGNTIGIVGGLIIGQAAVEANLVSPIVVIVVAFTALCSFSIPNEEFAFSFRILKFYIILMSAWLGFFGFLLGLLTVLIHLCRLKSFWIPYLMPFVGADLNDYEDERDSIWRAPMRKMTRRPIYARRGRRVKLKKKKGNG